MGYRVAMVLALLCLWACADHSGSDVASERWDISADHVFVDTLRQWILVNELPVRFDASSGAVELCANSCITVQADSGAKRRRGEFYPVTYQGRSYQLYWSELPMVSLQVEAPIVDEPRVPGRLILVQPGEKKVESVMGVELRGVTSQTLFPKKSFRIELWADSSGENTRKIPLLGLRNDDDWNLLSLYNEPLRVNNRAASGLWRALGHAGAGMESVELFLNGSYAGVYALCERVDAKMLDLETDGELYKGVGWGASTYTEAPDFDNSEMLWSGFEFQYPETRNWQKLANWVSWVVDSSETSFNSHYAQFLDVDKAVDYFIFMNALYIKDNTGKNVFVARRNVRNAYFFVPWDLDGSFGNYYDGSFVAVNTEILSNGLYDRLLLDCGPQGFRAKLGPRWFALRQGLLSTQELQSRLQGEFDRLNDAGVYTREKEVWGAAVQTELLPASLDWIDQRMHFLDVYVDSLDQDFQNQVGE